MPERYREEIARIDRRIIALVAERNAAAGRIGQIKAARNEDIVVPAVEQLVIQRFIEEGKKAGVSEACAVKIARAVIDEAVSVQNRLVQE
jgi:chorismate mutase